MYVEMPPGSATASNRFSLVTKRRSRTAFRGRLFNVTQIFSRRRGHPSIYETVHHPGSCAILPLLSTHRLVLLRQFRPSVGKTLWEIPAGTIEAGESALRCARREVQEETGYSAGRLRRIAVFYPSPGFCTEKIYLFLAEDLKPLSQRLEEDERIQVCPLSFRKAFQLLRQGKIVDAKTLIALLLLKPTRDLL